MNFCRRCGQPLVHVNNHVYKCQSGHVLFANSSPTVGIFIVTPNNEVLLSVRGIEPHSGMLDSFGGFCDGEESFEQAAARELNEELSLNPKDYESLRYLTSSVGHYPFKNETLPILSVFYWTRLSDSQKQLIPSDDVAGIHKVPLSDVDYEKLHDSDIVEGIRSLQSLLLT